MTGSVAALFAAALLLPQLSPEQPIEPVAAVRPAPRPQTEEAIASNGSGFLAVWSDFRSATAATQTEALYAAALNDDGTPAEPFGHPLVHFSFANALASDGANYLVAYEAENGLWTMQLDPAGHPLAPPVNHAGLGSAHDRLHLVWNGANYLLIRTAYWQYPSQVTARVLDPKGGQVAAFAVSQSGSVGGVFPTATGFDIVVVDGPNVVLDRLTTSGIQTSTTLPVSATSRIAAAETADRFVVVSASTDAASTHMDAFSFTRDGVLVHSARVYDGPPLATNHPDAISAASDGVDILVTWTSGGAAPALLALPLSSNGEVPASAPVILDPGASSAARFAAKPSKTMLLWADNDIVSRPVAGFRTIAYASPVVVSLATPEQRDVQMTNTPAGAFAAWIERDDRLLIRGGPLDSASAFTTFADVSVSFAVPSTTYIPADAYPVKLAIAPSSAQVLIAWTATTGDGRQIVRATRSSFSGRADDAAAEIATVVVQPPTYDAPSVAVASDGTNFLVCWIENRVVRGAIVRANGVASAPADISWPRTYAQQTPTVTWTGTAYVVTWREDRSTFGIQPGSVTPGPAFNFARVVDRNGVPAPVTSSDPTNPGTRANGASWVSSTAGPKGVVVTWIALSFIPNSINRCVYAMSLSAAATVVDSERAVYCTDVLHGPYPFIARTDIVWDGNEFVLVWYEQSEFSYFATPTAQVKAMRLSASLNPIDPQPFVVAAGETVPNTPAVSRSAAGAVIAYTHLAGRTFGDVPRLFERFLTSPALPQRRRAVR